MKTTEENYKYSYVMLIDDIELDNFINEKLIKTYNFSKDVYVNNSATGALEFLHTITSNNGALPKIYPEVIFVDINMPIVDGFQFINSFREIFQQHILKPKIVILTSSVARIDREKTVFISDEIIFLNKPLTKEMLDLI